MISNETKIPKKNKKEIEKLFGVVDTHRLAMDHHAGQCKIASKRAWGTVKHLLPNLKWDEYVFTYNEKEQSITCVGIATCE